MDRSRWRPIARVLLACAAATLLMGGMGGCAFRVVWGCFPVYGVGYYGGCR